MKRQLSFFGADGREEIHSRSLEGSGVNLGYPALWAISGCLCFATATYHQREKFRSSLPIAHQAWYFNLGEFCYRRRNGAQIGVGC